MKKIFLLYLFFFLTNTSFSQGWKKVADTLINVLKTAKEDSSKVNVLNSLSRNFSLTGDYDKAMNYANDALLSAEKINFKKGIASAYSKIGIIYQDLGKYPEALKNQLASLKIAEEIDDKHGIASIYVNIGNIYFQQGNFQDALKNHLLSLKIQQGIGNIQGIASSYLNIGNDYAQIGDYDLALKNYAGALGIAEKTKNMQEVEDASYNNIGNIYALKGNYIQSSKNFLSSLKIEEELGDKQGMATSFTNLGEINIKLNKPTEAKKYLDKALLLSKQIGSKEVIKQSYLTLSQYDSLTGNYDLAYHHYKLYSLMKDSLVNEESNRQISQLKIQYESDKKDQQINTQNLQIKTQYLKLQNQMLNNRILQTRIYYGIVFSIIIIGIIILLFYLRNKRKKREYEHMLVGLELTVLKSQLNPHFISNSLSAIKSFIDQQPQRASQYLAKIARLMRRVLEQNEQPLISLEEELQTVELYMQIESLRLEYGFDFRFELDNNVNAKLLMVPPLILQPLVENAIWHGLASKNEKGSIIIGIKLNDGLLKCTVEDNGNGDESMKERVNINPTERKSFGLSITRKRIEILSKELKRKGYINLNFLNGRTVAEIALPVNYH